MNKTLRLLPVIIVLALLAAACSPEPSALERTPNPTSPPPTSPPPTSAPVEQPAATGTTSAEPTPAGDAESRVEKVTNQEADVAYTLITGGDYGGLVFEGVGGEIDGEVNPTLTANPGDTVSITVINGDGIQHDFTIDEFDVQLGPLSSFDQQQTVVFTVDETGEYVYYCSVPGHRQAGMWGNLVVGEPEAPTVSGESIVHNPSDLPGPVGDRGPELVEVNLTAQEIEGQLADDTTMTYFTFNGSVPGPFIRVRVGDTVQLSLTNETGSQFSHSIDLHAVNGPGGGAVYTDTKPGETSTFTFTALNPGLYVYHCATPSVAHHIANGMYGMILVEPGGGLPEVDREFYVMQGEIYTEQPAGTTGHVDFSNENMLEEDPTYFVFNGAVGALTGEDNLLEAEVGDTVRIFMGVGGPNYMSSFHVIGEIFDRAYPFASLTSDPLTDVQTMVVPPGGATMVEFEIQEPGRYILVDHAISRLERGLVGFLMAEGEESADVFYEGEAETP